MDLREREREKERVGVMRDTAFKMEGQKNYFLRF
jgi:hypothetical protein